ncbi:MAG: hypothetical protein U0271_21970 [Polyangiaceae bacterium]
MPGRFAPLAVAALLGLAACSNAVGAGSSASDEGGSGTGGPIPAETLPCESPDLWPFEVSSDRYPIRVHYHEVSQVPEALSTLELLEQSWAVETGALGFDPPLADHGRCGDDDAFDVFIWAGVGECYVDVIAEEPNTPWDDVLSYMVVDPYGPYGGELLDVTLAHELNHACQATYDWWESPVFFEATSVYVEDWVFDGNNNYVENLADFQARPGWALDLGDNYETWFMYGAALYFHYLHDRYFSDDPTFLAELWRGARSIAGEQEPDLEDAIDVLLGQRAGIGFVDSVAEFARFRWYTGERDDGAHFSEGGLFPDDAAVAIDAVATGEDMVPISVMALGSSYIEIPAELGAVDVTLADADPTVDWVVQVVPGTTAAEDGHALDLTNGAATLSPVAGRTLIVTALPRAADADPERRTDAYFQATVSICPVP